MSGLVSMTLVQSVVQQDSSSWKDVFMSQSFVLFFIYIKKKSYLWQKWLKNGKSMWWELLVSCLQCPFGIWPFPMRWQSQPYSRVIKECVIHQLISVCGKNVFNHCRKYVLCSVFSVFSMFYSHVRLSPEIWGKGLFCLFCLDYSMGMLITSSH